MLEIRMSASLVMSLWLASNASAATYNVRPITFVASPGYSMTATGQISTLDGTSTITDWNLVVTTSELLAHYTPKNTSASVSDVSVTSDGTFLSVLTSVDPGVEDGGILAFRSPNPSRNFGVALADFSAPLNGTGQAYYIAGGAFDFLDLGQPAGITYSAASTNPSTKNQFNVTPLSFAGGVSLTGTITTNGITGPLAAPSILDWDISVNMLTQDVFTRANSSLHSSLLATSPDGANLAVENPDGFLGFFKGIIGGHPYALVLADFSDGAPKGGQAGYFQGRLSSSTIDLKAGRGSWAITGDEPVMSAVPAPSTTVLLATAIMLFAGLGRKRRTAASRSDQVGAA